MTPSAYFAIFSLTRVKIPIGHWHDDEQVDLCTPNNHYSFFHPKILEENGMIEKVEDTSGRKELDEDDIVGDDEEYGVKET